MHTLYFVKIKTDEKLTSEQARKIASKVLDENNFSSDSNGFFGSSKADWYTVGGRWSGLFSDKTLRDEPVKLLLKEEIEKTPDLLDYLYINDHMLTPEKRAELDAISIKATGLPYFRSSYGAMGYEDDALVITKELLRTLLNKYPEVEVAYVDGDGETIEDEGIVDKLDEDCIGDYLVTIDYHN